MKATGIVRKLDELGRVVLPKELRRTLGLAEKDPVEIFVDGESIIIRKYAPGCTLCGSVESPLTTLYPSKAICTPCVSIITNLGGKVN